MSNHMKEEELLHRMAAYCSIAERCEQDVEKKIRNAGFSSDVSDRIINHLKKEKFIDESRFCQSFVNDKLRFNKWGRIKINYELRNKKIPSSIIQEALTSINKAEYEDTLRTLLRVKRKTIRGKNERDIFTKLFRYAIGRGFESELITKILQESEISHDYDEEIME